MRLSSYHSKTHKPQHRSASSTSHGFDPSVAGHAIVDGLLYLKIRWAWSGSRIARVIHLPANTVNTWLKNGCVPINHASLQPDVQAVIHLLAIHRSLEAMFENPEHQLAWLMTFHPQFGAVPENKMEESIDGLIFIRQYLDYTRGKGA